MLLDFEEIKNKVNNTKWYGTEAWYDILDAIADCEDKSRPKGNWIDMFGMYRCSNCNHMEAKMRNFCEDCGADMR